MALALPKSKLYAANAQSTTVWQADLKNLFHHAKERYADVVWEVAAEGDDDVEEVYGHKAIVYARAPTTFQATYFSFRPAPPATPDPYGGSPGPDQSSYSVHINPPSPSDSMMQDYDHMRGVSPSPSQMQGLLRLTTSINPALFSNELEYLYTAQGMGEAFEFLFDAPEQRDYNESEEDRLSKLRKDLCYMWRSRLFSDVRIALTGDFRAADAPPDAEDTAVVFFSHRFILVSRSPYFHKALQSSFQPPTAPLDGGTLTLQLPSTAFTPASLHWVLGFMYAGTINFSHRTFDLDTAFAIVRSSAYLLMTTMRVEIEAFIVEEMLHGLFHAYLTFEEYEKITAGKWGVGGCRCRQCQRRIPRVLEFSLAPDIGNKVLERGSRRALVGIFGEGWCTSEFASLSTKMRALLLKGVQTRTTSQNIFPLLFAAEAALARLENVNDAWREVVEELIVKARKTIDEVMCDSSEAVFEQQEWLEIMDSDGQQFQDMDRVEWIMQSVVRGLKDANAPRAYQTIVSSILLRPHPTDTSATLLPSQSPVRARVEEARSKILNWIKKHWINIRLVGGFDTIEQWALKEIGHELEMNVPDLQNPTANNKGATTRTGLRATIPKEKPVDPDMEASSITAASMRASVLNRNMAKSSNDPLRKESPQSVKISIRAHPYGNNRDKNRNSSGSTERDSLAASTSSFSSARSLIYPEVESPTASTPVTPRLTGATFGRSATMDSMASTSDNHTRARSPTTSTAPPARNVPARRMVVNSTTSAAESPAAARPKSLAASVKSTASTIRRGGPAASSSNTAVSPTSPVNTANGTGTVKAQPRKVTASTTTRPGPRISTTSLSRPSSRVSDVSSSFKSAKEDLDVPPVPRTRTISMASTTSTMSMKTDGGSTTAVGRGNKLRGNTLTPGTPKVLRPRKTSDASVISTASLSHPRGNVTPKRPSSQASVRSTVSTRANTTRTTPTKAAEKVPDVPKRVPRVSTTSNRAPSVTSTRSVTVKKTTPAATAPTPVPPPSVIPTPPKATEIKEEPKSFLPIIAPPVIVHDDAEERVPSPPPPVPSKESNGDTIDSLSGLPSTSLKDKRPSAASTMSTNSGSTIRVVRKKSNDTITERTEKDMSTLRAKTLAKLVGTTVPSGSGSPSRPSAIDVVSPSITSAPPAPSTSMTITRNPTNQQQNTYQSPSTPTPEPPVTATPAMYTSPSAPPSAYSTPAVTPAALRPQFIPVTNPQGITLNVGIPCIITSRRARFRAFARYLGEIAGEAGPWVGVEVPLGEFAGGDKLGSRNWHDGSWNGIRYFDVVGAAWEEEERGGRRRATGSSARDPYGGGTVRGKRDMDTLSVETRERRRMRSVSPAVSDASVYESRGLFIRPQQVLFVIGAREDY